MTKRSLRSWGRCSSPTSASAAPWSSPPPGLDEQKLDKRLLADFAKRPNSDLINALDELLPKKLIGPLVERSGVDPRRKVHDITREQRRQLAVLLKALPVEITGPRPVEEAIVTSGGVTVGE